MDFFNAGKEFVGDLKMDYFRQDKNSELISPFLKADLVIQAQQVPGMVSFENYEQLKARICEGVSYYSGFEYSLDTYQIALKHHDELKYVKNILQKAKKQIEKSYNEPLENVQKRIDELIDLIKTPFKKVETFIKANEKNAKKYEIYIFAEEAAKTNGLCSHAESIIRSPAFFEQRWLNASCSTAKWRFEVLSKIKKAILDIAEIEAEQNENIASAVAYYYQTLSKEKVVEFLDSLRYTAQNAERAESTAAPKSADVYAEQLAAKRENARAAIQEADASSLNDTEILNCVADSINPFTGEILAGVDDSLSRKIREIADKLESLTLALLGRRPKKQEKKPRNDSTRVGERWTLEEEQQLAEEFQRGLSVFELAQLHNRKRGGIAARLKKLGLLE